MNNLLTQSFDRLLANCSTPEVVRQVERGETHGPLWARIHESGYLDALVPESAGGAGLSLADAFPLFVAEGRHALPVPLAHTMLVRAVLASAGIEPPAGALAIASQVRVEHDGAVSCPATPYGRVADWVVVGMPESWLLLPTAGAAMRNTGIHGSLRADLRWPAHSHQTLVAHGAIAWREAGAAIAAAQLAGAMERALGMTVAYANERIQFGRSIGKFQAIQHQLSVMAEHVFAAHMAAELGCSGRGPLPHGLRAAVAKARASEAATITTSIAHAVHGAIGCTAEVDLQIYTRRIHEWRADFGSEQHWSRVLGRALLASDAESTLAFMRADLIPLLEEIQ